MNQSAGDHFIGSSDHTTEFLDARVLTLVIYNLITTLQSSFSIRTTRLLFWCISALSIGYRAKLATENEPVGLPCVSQCIGIGLNTPMVVLLTMPTPTGHWPDPPSRH